MRKLLLLALMLLFSFNLALIGRADNDQAKVDAVLNRLEIAQKQLRSLKASIVQSNHNSQVNSTEIEKGIIYLVPSDKGLKLRMDIEVPAKRTVVIADGKVWYYINATNETIKSDLPKARDNSSSGFAVTLGSVAAIRENYHVSYAQNEEIKGIAVTKLHLEPKQKGHYLSGELWISDKFAVPIKQRLEEANHAIIEVQLNDIGESRSAKDQKLFNEKQIFDDYISKLEKQRK